VGGSIGGGYGGSALYTNSYNLPMKTRTNELSKPTSINALVQDIEKHPDRYQHLKIFLRHDNSTGIPDFGEQYLAVRHDGFALYRLDSVDYQDGNIILSLTEQSTNQPVKFSVDINNAQPSCLFIRWKDVKNMVFDECMKRDVNDNDLLELIG
jgi:hypothetical protein